MNIAFIGASGFVGSKLMELLRKGSFHQFINMDIQPNEAFEDVTVIGDVRDKKMLRGHLAGYDLVVVLAATYKGEKLKKKMFYDVNVDGMQNILDAMDTNDIKRIIYISTASIYGHNRKKPDESHPPYPEDEYSKTKWLGERVLQLWYQKHADWTIDIIRPTLIFGEDDRGMIYDLICSIANGKFRIIGDGNNIRALAYIENVVKFIKFIIENKTDGYHVYNYADKPDYTINTLTSAISYILERESPRSMPKWFGQMSSRYNDFISFFSQQKPNLSRSDVKWLSQSTECDASKMLATGFTPPYTLNNALERTIKYEFAERSPAIEADSDENEALSSGE